MLHRKSLRILAALDSRIVIVSVSVLIILIFYFYITSNNYPPRFSDIQPPSSSPCALDFINQVNCLSNHSLGSKKISIGIESTQAQQQEQVNFAVKTGTALERSGNLKEAIKYYDKALLLDPIDPDLLVMKGDALSHMRNYTGAIIYYDKALAIQPNSRGSTGIMEGIGDDLYHLGKYKEAIRSYEKALAVQPNNPDLLINKGNALFHIANYSGAIKYYDKALTMTPNDVLAGQGKKLAVIALQKSANNSTK